MDTSDKVFGEKNNYESPAIKNYTAAKKLSMKVIIPNH